MMIVNSLIDDFACLIVATDVMMGIGSLQHAPCRQCSGHDQIVCNPHNYCLTGVVSGRGAGLRPLDCHHWGKQSSLFIAEYSIQHIFL